MEDFEEKRAVQRVIERALSGVKEDPWMAQRVLRTAHARRGKGGRTVKRKLSVGLIVLLAVLANAVVALAWALAHPYFEDVAQIQSAQGYYDDWCWEEKQNMVKTMQTYGLITEDEAAALSTEEAVDAYMMERYGIDGRSDTIGLWAILEAEKGAFAGWSLEEKAWYTDMQTEAGLQTAQSDEPIYGVPTAADIQPDEAIAIAREAILEAFGLDSHALDEHQIEIDFRINPEDENPEMHYEISFWGEAYADRYFCAVTRDGRIMDSSMGDLYRSPAESVKEKQQFLNETDLEATELFMAYAQEHITGDFAFPFWPLEDKKAVTDMLRPIILENMAENPHYADQVRIFWATHLYGLPDEKAISQDEALEIARNQLTAAFGLTDEQAAWVDRAGLFYEVTDSANPLWKITLCISSDSVEAARETGLKTNVQYRVVIHAYTGEVLETHGVTEVHDDNPEEVALSN